MANESPLIDPAIANPFLGGIVSDAWRGGESDVPEIHSDVYRQCLDAIESVRKRQRSAAILIHGEQGSGKTHLLSRLQRRLTEIRTFPELDDQWQIFVYLRMRTSSGRIWRKIRHQLAADLMRPMWDELTQLDLVLAKRLAICLDGHGDLALWWAYHRENSIDELVDAWHQFALQTGLRHDVAQVIEWFIRRKHRRHVWAYLSGGLLSEEGIRSLFGNVDPSQHSSDNEDDAFEAVKALCEIAGTEIPMVFCFDQIEAIEVEDASHQPVWYMARAIADLVDETRVTVISCVLATFADSEIRQQDLARLISGGRTALQRLDEVEMRRLIRSRVASFTATVIAARNDENWPFGNDASLFEFRRTPRELLHLAAIRFDLLRGATPPQATQEPQNASPDFPWVSAPLATTFERRLEEAMQSQNPQETDDLIASTLPLMMSIVEAGWTVEHPVGPHNAQNDIEMILVAPDQEARVGVVLCNQPSMTSLAARLNRLIRNRKAFRLQKLILVRDARLPISPGAVATRSRLNEIMRQDGVLLRPTQEVMAVLDAVRSLIADATCGDLSLNGQAVSVSTVRQWLADHLDSTTREWIDEFRLPARPGWDHGGSADLSDHCDVDSVLEYLSSRPLSSLPEVSQSTGIDESRIVKLPGIAGDRLGVISGDPSVVFRVVNEVATEDHDEKSERSRPR